MTTALDTLLAVIVVLVLWPVAVVALQCLLALLPAPRRPEPAVSADLETVVLIPAHDEELVIAETLGSLRADDSDGPRILVVADNCRDRTAAIARAAGAEVIERHDPEHRGKGYALDHGVRALATRPPAVVVVVDADCRISPAAVRLLARRAAGLQRPVQATYYLTLPERHRPQDRVSALAFLVKNVARPRGLDRLGLPCALTGTGMAFPWSVLAAAPLASGNIVEDLQLGLDLALAGFPPLHCREAEVTSPLPEPGAAVVQQRTRWEHGHLQTLLRWGPRLVARGLVRGRIDLVALGLDLAVPPLSLLVLMLGVAGGLAAAGGWLGASWRPLVAVAIGLMVLGLALGAAWWQYGRRFMPARSLLAIPFYVLGKLPIYLAFLRSRQRQWVSTTRSATAEDAAVERAAGPGGETVADPAGDLADAPAEERP